MTPAEEYQKLAGVLGLSSPLLFKREDLHPYGSQKGRSIPHMIRMYAKHGASRFAISSSGNAALAAAHATLAYNEEFPETPISLEIFVGENVNKAKLARLEEFSGKAISISQVERPKQAVHKLNKSGEAKALRQSKDDSALAGYKELADELLPLKPTNLFVPTSSGTTAQALAELMPETDIHIVQTSKVHTLAGQFDSNFTLSDSSVADAIVDIVGERKIAMSKVVKHGWVVDDSEINEAIALTKEHTDVELSANSALAVAGIKKALASGENFSGPAIALITGI